MRYFALKSALKLYCSFKVTEKQRQKINEEKDSEKQRQIEIERYIINVLVTHALVKVFIIFQLSCKRILLLHKSRFYMLCRGETADVIVQLQDLVLCDNPGCNNPTRLYCIPCREKICTGCTGSHTLKKSKKAHTIVEYKDRIQHGDVLYCKTHDHKKCELYCEKCEIPVCSKCVSGKSHRGHTFTETLALFDIKRTCVIKESDNIKNHIQLLKEQMEVMDSKLKESEQKYKNLVSEVGVRKEEMLKAVERATNNQLQKIGNLKTLDINQIQAQKEELEQQIAKANAVLESREGLLKGHSPSELFSFESKASDLKDIPEMIVQKEHSFKKGSLSTEVIEGGFGEID